MAAKYLHSLTDENPDLQKQVGCMTGVFQIFNRHHMVAERRVVGHSLKRARPGSSHFNNGTPERESSCLHQRPTIVINDQSLDLRDVVKDSMYREARGLSHKTTTNAPDDLVNYRESINALAELREANWNCDEPKELSRSKSCQFKDGSSFSVPKDCPRFSYDGRETDRISIKSGDTTTAKQLKEPSRLSLDRRERSIHNLNSISLVPIKPSDSKSNLPLRNPKTDGVISADKGLLQTRPPSVVAKLMGLGTFPDSASASNKMLGVDPTRTHPVKDLNLLALSSKGTNLCGSIKMLNSSRSSLREPTSPCWKNPDMKPISRVPIEPAPWKQRDGAESPRKPASHVFKSPTKTHNHISSVYSEVDKRLKHLEFTQSGKDLRALKQILEAMQSMESRKSERQSIANQEERFFDHSNPPSSSTGSNISRVYQSPIVIMKPAKLVEKAFTNSEEGRDPTNEVIHGENAVNFADVKAGRRHVSSGKSLASSSPRLQQKSSQLERQSRSSTPPKDSIKPRKLSSKPQSESSSYSRRQGPKSSNFRQNDDQNIEPASESRKFSYKETQMSQQVSCARVLKIDAEVTASEYSEETDSRQSSSSMQEKSTLLMKEGDSLAPEYPSPVSVLDDSAYMEDSPSPVKHLPNAQKGDLTQYPSEKFVKDQCQAADNGVSNTISSSVASQINHEKLQDIEHLVQKLRRLNSSHDEAHTDFMGSLCQNTNPDSKYIGEIFLASGLLLQDIGSFEFHPSGHPFNPELFLVLEQTKFSNVQKGKIHRKLIFDAVNEILGEKLQSASRKNQNVRKLLKELCLEIEQLQVKKKREQCSFREEDDEGLKSILWEDVLNRSEGWTGFAGENPVIAVEVERLIFKDLVNEVIVIEACDGR